MEVATSAGRIPLNVVLSRDLPSDPGMVTVFRDAAQRWWASFTCEVDVPYGPATFEHATGLDMGLTTFATTEFPDADIENPRFARSAAKALARSQLNMARKKKGSKNRAKARVATAKVSAKVANQRKDWRNKQTRTLAQRFDRIGVEDLKIKNMQRRGNGRRKAGLNRSIADAGWGDFIRTLDWQCRKAGHEMTRINPRNTTQNCSACGTKAKPRIELSDRIFRCHNCGHTEDRDRNAARNLNPNRLDCSVRVGKGDDGHKTSRSKDHEAA